MKKNLILIILALMPFRLFAQSYDALWKQVDEAGKKDLPKTQIATLKKIAAKAETDKNYGQLLSARLMAAGLQVTISPDSADVEIARLVTLAEKAEAKDPVLAAVYQTALGRIYNRRARIDGKSGDEGKAFFKQAMSHPELLAQHKASEYTPLISKNEDSRIFGDDLLHVIGMETKDYETLYNYYKGMGNRPAACIVASLWKSTIAELDSLIDIYGDLPEAGELAKKRYTYMRYGFSAEEKVAYIDRALDKWRDWELIGSLCNERKSLTNPSFNASLEYSVNIPGRANNVSFTKIRNIRELTMRVSMLNANGDTEAVRDRDYAKLARLIKSKDVFVKTLTYTGKKDYEEFSDSIKIAGMPVGVYLVEFYADGKRLDKSKTLYYVSDLRAMTEALPNKKVRCVIVNATTGQPVPGAIFKLVSRKTGGKIYKYTADKDGEIQISQDIFGSPYYKYVYTERDKSCPEMGLWTYYGYSEDKDDDTLLYIYTDRKIYRPGQDVHAAVVVYNRKNGVETSVLADKDVRVSLRDANIERVAEKTVKTDKYGTAHVDFTIPQGGLTGRFSVEAECGESNSVGIQVEEYKRPTFKIEFPDYKEQYAAGDTVRVKAYAKTYAGMPVQGAKVEYHVGRHRAFWCWWSQDDLNENDLYEGEAVTDVDGAFEMIMPMEMPDADDYEDGIVPRRGAFFNFIAEAKVTDMGGESHSGTFSLPLGTKPTALSCDLPDMVLSDSLKQITFNYTNAANKPINGAVSFTLGGKAYKNQKANAPIAISGLKSGKHHLFAVCGNDTIEQDVVVFSLKDKKPVVETDDWFYVSAEDFPTDGKPVHLQIGSSAIDQHIVYNVFTGNKILESGVIEQSNALCNREFTYKDEYGDGITVTYAWMKNGEMYTHRATIRKPLPDKRLLLEWKTFRDRLTPGQEEEWILQVKRPDGKTADALLIASMYDKSLDQLYQHYWNTNLWLLSNTPNTNWDSATFGSAYVRYAADNLYNKVRILSFSRFDNKYFNALEYYGSYLYNNLYGYASGVQVRKSKELRVRGAASMAANMAKMEMSMADSADGALQEVVTVGYGVAKKEAKTGSVSVMNGGGEMSEEEGEVFDNVQMRENLNETAFFYPNLITDADGNVNIKFQLPESVTTWKFMGYAHDKNMNYGTINGETVARKTVMVQPNMPRFVRVGDKAQIASRLFNSSENAVSGKARIELVDPESDAVVYSDTKDYTISANGTSNVSFALDMPSVLGSASHSTLNSNFPSLLICRIMASGNGYSDGEQHYLPILPDMEMVTNTVPFTQNGAGVKEIAIPTPQSSFYNKVTVEYTNNPAWLMIQALPFVGNANENNAISLVSAFYANSLANNMLNSSPKIRQVFEQWRAEKGDETSLMSSLQKDQSLKNLVLNETPWVADAKNEAEQKQNIAQFFNENNVNNRLETAVKGLKKLQNADGSWSWWSGMDGSPWMTVTVCKTLARLNKLIGNIADSDKLLDKGMEYLVKEIKEEVTELKKAEKKGAKNLIPSELALNYLYVRSITGGKYAGSGAQDVAYLVKLLAQNTSKLTIYGKANSAIILAKNGYATKAKTFLKSLKEYSVYTEEMGRYFDTPKAYYSWFDYRIPTEVAAIEALQMLTPQDTQTVEEMQRWLLQEKCTQAWDTPVNSIDAVYAFFCGKGSDGGNLFGDKLAKKEQTVLKIDGKPLELPQATAGMGYVKTTVQSDDAKTFTAEKTSAGTSWGAVYAQFLQSATEIEDAASGIKVQRELFVEVSKKDEKKRKTAQDDVVSLKVGDKVKVVITITADRDYDFVQVTDKRAACLEPATQLSGYRYGYYCAPKDNVTNYYFDRMAKGKHVIETEYYVDRAGRYSTGTCMAQCAYAPEYIGRTKAKQLNVDEDK